MQYSPVGSGAGIAAITNRQVDFGASDAPLTPDQQTACKNCVQIPWALSATAIAYNVPGAPAHLNLDGKTISKIFLGQITSWNDPAIKALNKGANMPEPADHADLPLGRFRHDLQLHRLSRGGQRRMEVEGGRPRQPSASRPGIGARGSSGVAGLVTRTEGGITYVDVAFALKNHIKFAAVRNAAGKFLFPSLRRITEAAKAFPKVPADNELHIVNPPKKYPLAYPISTYTYVILPQQTSHAQELRKFVFWALTQGQTSQYTAKLLFAPLPKPVLVAPRRRSNRFTSKHDGQAAKGRRSGAPSAVHAGNVQRMRRPWPRAPSACTSPPAAATMCLTIASPRPVPRDVRAASPR